MSHPTVSGRLVLTQFSIYLHSYKAREEGVRILSDRSRSVATFLGLCWYGLSKK
jgi:hypothetical protein